MKSFILIFALFFFATPAFADSGSGEKPKEVSIKVSGMMCGACERKVEGELKKIDEVKEVKASHNNGEVKIILTSIDIEKEKIKEAVEKAGFKVISEKEKKRDRKKEN